MARLSNGETIAGFRIDSFVGRGGMGEVYRAREVESGRVVALKLILGDGDEAFEDRFGREAAVAASLDHPNVASVYEAGTEGGRSFIAMRFVEGVDLATVLARGPLELGRALDILSQVADALDAAHDRGLVHRDVKPGNILLERLDGQDEQAFLADFGLVKELAVNDGATATGVLLGTPDYMAPEQVHSGIADARSDVYALGCVLFQMLTGRVPFPRESEVAKIWAHVNDDAPSLAELAPDLPEGLDAVIAKAMAKEPEDRYGSAGDLARAAVLAAGGSLPEGLRAVAVPEPRRAAAPCPYKGLAAFQPEDAGYFFGREELVAELVARLGRARFLAVVGASGSGKSSLVRAGLLPALGAPFALITPGDRPLESLAGVGEGELLAVDQFEELFTLCRDEAERQTFLERLLTWPEPVVIVLRADFYGYCADYPTLAAALEGSQALVGPMGEQELRRAIEHPAQRVGLHLEHRLIETTLHDVLGQPGALPLLSHALLETWKRRIGRTLTLGGYLEAGGVEGAVAKTAEELYRGLPPEQQPLVRSTFLRLTALGEGTEDTRRRVGVDELVLREGEEAQVEAVVERLAEARLVIRDERTVEVAHEALIRHWPTLRAWLDEDREGRRIHRRLTEAAQEWHILGREQSALYRGARFAAATEWADANPGELNEQERAFLEASRAAEQSELDRARRRNRRLRVLVAALAVLLAGAAVAAVIAVRQTGQARDHERNANAQEQIARREARVQHSLRLAGQAEALAPTELDLALLLGVEARRLDDSHEARSGLLAAVMQTPSLTGFDRRFGAAMSSMALAGDRSGMVIGTEDGEIRLWGLGTREPSSESVDAGVGLVLDTAFSPDGEVLAVSGDDGTRLFNANTLKPLTGTLAGVDVEWIAFSPDGKRIAASSASGILQLWAVPSGRRAAPPLRVSATRATSIAFFPDGQRLVVGTSEGTAVPVDAETGTRDGAPFRVTTNGETYALAISPDGRTLAAGAEDGAIVIWDLPTQAPRSELLSYHDSQVYAMSFSPDGKLLASTDDTGAIAVWDTRTSAQIGEPLLGHGEFVFDLAFSGPHTLLSAAVGEVATWDLDSYTLGYRIPVGPAGVERAAVSPDGRLIATGAERGGVVHIWDVSTRQAVGPPISTGLERLFALDWASETTITAGGAAAVESGKPRLGRVITLAVGNPKPRAVIDVGRQAAYAVGLSAGGLVAVGHRPGLAIWDVRSGRLVDRLGGRDVGKVATVAFSPDGKQLAAGARTGVITLWRLADRRRLWSTKTGANVNEVAWLPDGESLVGGNGLGSLVVLDATTGKTLKSAQPGIGELLGAAVSEDGAKVAVSSTQGSVALLDLVSGETIILPAHDGAANDVSFVDQDRALASAGHDGVLLISEIDPDWWEAQACRLAGRDLTATELETYLGSGKEQGCTG